MMKALMLISDIMVAVLAMYYTLLLLYAVVGVFSKKKRYPPAEPSRIAVMICARNEESVIGNLLDSLLRQDYPADKMQIFVVAHNCTDETARIAREKGATVLERNDPAETYKGHALRYGVGKLKELYPDAFDILCVFDADNVAGKTFLKEINAALHSGADMAQGYRHSKNYHTNGVSELFGAYWYQIMLSQNLPHTTMRLPSIIGGTGFGVKTDALADGWNTDTLLEDIEFSCQMALAGKRSILAPYAVFYDEQPTSLKIGLRQRYRWAVGGYQLTGQYLPKLFRAIPKRGAAAVKIILDLAVNYVMLISCFGFLLHLILSGITGGALGVGQYLAVTLGSVWLSVLPATIVMFLRERLNPLKNLYTLFLFPFFLLLSMPLSFPALFDTGAKWKPIPHTDATTIDELENAE